MTEASPKITTITSLESCQDYQNTSGSLLNLIIGIRQQDPISSGIVTEGL